MTIEEMKACKDEKNYSFSYLSRNTGIPMGTLQKIFGGITKTPRYETMQELEAFFRKEASGSRPQTAGAPEAGCPKQYVDAEMVRETSSYGIPQKKADGYSISDYEAVPEGKRMELIDGVLYDMGAPLPVHQIICMKLSRQIGNFIDTKHGNCIVAAGPLDVQLDEDNHTMVEPDLIIVCDRTKFSWKRMHGAPDFAAEILSESTKKRDRYLKLAKYMAAGVREYWIIDPEYERIVVYLKDEAADGFPTVYTFADQVPVHIFQDELKVDFALLRNEISFLYELDRDQE